MPYCKRDPRVTGRGFKCAESRGCKDVPGELQVPPVVVDDQDDWTLRLVGLAIMRIWGRRPILQLCHSGSCWRTTTTSFVRA